MTRLLVAALVTLVATPAAAGKPSAKQVLSKVQAFYKNTRQYKADFEQTYTNTTFGAAKKSKGDVYLKRPGKMRWDYKRKSKLEKTFVSDGKRLWGIEVDSKQAYSRPLSTSVMPVAVSFLLGRGKLSKNFTATIANKSKYGGAGEIVLELTPKQPSARYKTLWLVVSAKNYDVRKSIVLESTGNTNQFEFANANRKAKLADKLFRVSRRALTKQGYRILTRSSGTPTSRGSKSSP